MLFTPPVTRTIRAATLTEAQLDYVTSAKMRGENGLFIITREILPNIVSVIVVELTARIGFAIFSVATLAFLGLVGEDLTDADWGVDVAESYEQIATGRLVADDIPGVGDCQPGHRREPHRRLHRQGNQVMTATDDLRSSADTDAVSALTIRDLEMSYIVRGIPRQVLRGVSLDVKQGEAYGLVGESGCGKSTTAYAALRYLPSNGRITNGTVVADGRELTSISARELREFRAGHASMVYQDPVQAVNPVLKIGRQVAEAFTILGQSKSEARASALEALKRVRIAAPESVMERYPHQLSGGMLQRVVIAMALASNPKLLVLDEPTTGLDATVEAEVLELVTDLRAETDAAILLIAHNLAVIRTMCDRMGVMYAGRVVEEGTVDEVFENPSHPYTVGLLNSIPRRGLRKTDRELFAIPGTLPQIGDPLPTCVYVDRCPIATQLCRDEVPPIAPRSDGHWTRCHHADRIDEVPEPEEVSTRSRGWHRRDHRSAWSVQDLPPTRPSRAGLGRRSISDSLKARPWDSSGNLVRESRRWPRPCWAYTNQTKVGPSPSEAGRWLVKPLNGSMNQSGPCRWSFRIRTPPSIERGRFDASLAGRLPSSPGSRATPSTTGSVRSPMPCSSRHAISTCGLGSFRAASSNEWPSLVLSPATPT